MRTSDGAPHVDHNFVRSNDNLPSPVEAHRWFAVAHRAPLPHPKGKERSWEHAPLPQEARSPMYTRRIRPPFARRRPLFWAALALLGCHTMPSSKPAGPPPKPTSVATVQVGYGTQAARDVNTAVSSASGEKMRSNSPRTVADMLVGRFPGVEVRQLPNGVASIRIRGSRSFRSNEEPLIVVDGIPQHGGSRSLMDLNPRDVESIEVLKDAAATGVFGSRGANGVILVSTRRPM